MNFYLGIHNTGVTTISVSSSATPMNLFSVLREDCVSLETACTGSGLYLYPEVVYYYGETIAIPPGECVTRTGAWNGRVSQWNREETVEILPEPGSYVVLAGLYQLVSEDPGRTFVIPQNGITLPVVVDSQVAAPPPTWGRLKARYRGAD